jgi:hypothetical protein
VSQPDASSAESLAGPLADRAQDADPAAGLYRYVSARPNLCWVSSCFRAVVRLGVAKVVTDESRFYKEEDVADKVGLNANTVTQALRALPASGAFDDREAGAKHDNRSALLKARHPSIPSSSVRWAACSILWDALAGLDAVLRTVRPEPAAFFAISNRADSDATAFDHTIEAVSAPQVRELRAHRFPGFHKSLRHRRGPRASDHRDNLPISLPRRPTFRTSQSAFRRNFACCRSRFSIYS